MGKLSNIKILLVDDDSDIREILKEHLILHGGLVAEANDGSKAFEMIKMHDFDVVVSDLRMPNTSGIELIKLVRGYAGKAPRMILMSSFADLSSEQARDLGAEGLYLKPQNIKDLIELISDS